MVKKRGAKRRPWNKGLESVQIIFSQAGAPVLVVQWGSTHEPSAEILDCRGGTRFFGLQRRVFTPDEGSPHFERHWRFADSSSALGPCKNREHSEISRSQNKG
jgi:hypothetical protein